MASVRNANLSVGRLLQKDWGNHKDKYIDIDHIEM